jgi:hypothetical protein
MRAIAQLFKVRDIGARLRIRSEVGSIAGKDLGASGDPAQKV